MSNKWMFRVIVIGQIFSYWKSLDRSQPEEKCVEIYLKPITIHIKSFPLFCKQCIFCNKLSFFYDFYMGWTCPLFYNVVLFLFFVPSIQNWGMSRSSFYWIGWWLTWLTKWRINTEFWPNYVNQACKKKILNL